VRLFQRLGDGCREFVGLDGLLRLDQRPFGGIAGFAFDALVFEFDFVDGLARLFLLLVFNLSSG